MKSKIYKVVDSSGCVGITAGKRYYSFRDTRQNWVCLYNDIGREVWYPLDKVIEND